MNTLATLTADDHSRERDSRASGIGIVLAGDRSGEFRRARWHSAGVRALRVGLPLSSLAVGGLYVWTMLSTAGWGTPPAAPTITATLDKDIAMDNPRYEGFTKDGGHYTVTAKTAIPDLKAPSQVKLNAITGEMFDAKKSRTDLTATRGFFDSKANKLDLFDGITVVTETGMRAKLATATLLTKEGTLVSDTPVAVEMPAGTVTSNRLSLNQKTRDVTFLDHVIAHLVPPEKPLAQGAATTKPAQNTTPFGNAKAPVDITADRLDIHDVKKTARFEGNVRAVQGGATLETAALDITYAGGAKGSDGLAPAAPSQPATKIERILAPGPIVMTQGTGERITGNSADFDATGESAVITGDVIMTAGTDRRASSDRAEFQQKSDTIRLDGAVVVTQGRNELRGRRLIVERKSGQTELASPAEGALPRSRIFARLYQGDGKPAKPTATAKAAAPGSAEAADAVSNLPGVGFASFKTDPNAPVDIEADRLRIDDTKKEATFTGDVKAAQGDFIIQTSQMHAFYTGEAGLAAATPGTTAATPAGAKTPAQLTRIEAKGKVVVTSKANQRVTGDWAIFDTKANTVTVGGDQVIVTQDKNIVNGNKLTIDMATGQSVIVSDAPGPAAPGGAQPQGKPKGRSSMVFYPQERKKDPKDTKDKDKDPNAAAKPAQPGRPAASSWESTIEPSRPN